MGTCCATHANTSPRARSQYCKRGSLAACCCVRWRRCSARAKPLCPKYYRHTGRLRKAYDSPPLQSPCGQESAPRLVGRALRAHSRFSSVGHEPPERPQALRQTQIAYLSDVQAGSYAFLRSSICREETKSHVMFVRRFDGLNHARGKNTLTHGEAVRMAYLNCALRPKQ